MYRGLRPAPLNMALIPGRHLSTSKGRRPVTPHKDRESSSDDLDVLASLSTTADCESVASLGGPPDDADESPERGAADRSATLSPLDGVLLRRRRHHAMQQAHAEVLQGRGRGGALLPRAGGGRGPGAADCRRPDSPLGGMLLRARRRNALARGAWPPCDVRAPDSPLGVMLLMGA